MSTFSRRKGNSRVMSFSAPFIQRPVATTLIMVGLSVLGLVAYALLPIAGVPQVDVPTIQVSAALPGANAETMATAVAAPLERQLAQISGVVSLSSTSSLGQTDITAEFDLSRTVDSAAQDVQTAINAASGQLPKNLPDPPTYEKVNPADALLMSIAVTSDDLPITTVDKYVEDYIALQVSRVLGVGQVDYHGQQKPAVRVQVDPAAVAALGLGLEDVRAALGTATANSPKGTLDGPNRSLTLDTTDQLYSAKAYNDVVIAYHNGAPVRVSDIGRAIDGVQDIREAAWVGHHRAIVVDVHKQAGYNINETTQRIKDALPALRQLLPPSMHMEILGDRTATIRAAVTDVETTLAISTGLVVLVVFLFLRHVSATIIPSVTIPISLLCTCPIMYLAGYTIDNISLMALTIAVGYIIDDGIVVVENIMRHLEAGMSPREAALAGSREIGFTVVSMTLSLVAVFIPLLLMGGLVGRLFREFAVAASIAILVSGVVSLTLTPMMCGQLLRPAEERREGPVSRWLEAAFNRLLGAYALGLRWSLRHRLTMVAVMVVTLGATAYCYLVIPKGFFPQQDDGFIVGSTEAAQDISYAAMVDRQRAVAKMVLADADVQTAYYWVGANPSVNTGRIMIVLKPLAQRRASATQVLARLRKATMAIPGITLFGQARQDVQIGTKVSKTQYQYTVQDPDIAELLKWAPILLDKLSSLPQLRDVDGDLQAAAPRLVLREDRDLMGRLGITPQVVDDTLYDAFGQRQVATIFTQLDQYHVILEAQPRYQESAAALDQLYIASKNGQMVPLSALAHYERSVAPLTIDHQDQYPSVTLSFNLAPGYALGDAIAAIRNLERSIVLPAALTTRFEGSAKAFVSSLATQPYLIAAAILAVYIVLGVLYESFIHPITILSTLPSAGLGAFIALMLLQDDFSLIALIGIILLVGIVKKNAIMMVDFALDRERRQGFTPEAAIYEAALLRFRPIMMTTMAALMGGVPLALGSGAGAELRRPLGIVIVGGLLLSQVLTLYTTPVIYLLIDRLRRMTWRERLRYFELMARWLNFFMGVLGRS